MPVSHLPSPRLATLAFVFLALFVGGLLTGTTLRGQGVELALTNLARVYTAAPQPLDPATDLIISPGTVADYTLTITYAGKTTAPTNAGSYAVRVVAKDTDNPALTATTTGTLVIAKVPLTATPDNQARLFGAPNPPLTLSYAGFLGADTERVLDRRPVATTLARTTSPAGDYEITVSGGLDNNYALSLGAPATLTIVPAFHGTYEALLYPIGETETPAGKFTLTLPARGTAFTGRLELAGSRELSEPNISLPLSGKLAPTETLDGATAVAERRLSNGDTHRVEFTVTDAGLSAALYYRFAGDTENVPSRLAIDTPTRLATYTRAAPHPAAGVYTAALLNPSSLSGFSLFFPEGAGFATASLSTTGVLKLTGKLADGSTLTASASADAAAPDATPAYRFRLFLRPYGFRTESFVSGDFTLKPHPDEDRAGRFIVSTDSLVWSKAPKPSGTPDKLYPEGFGPLSTNFVLDPWTPPAKARAATSTTEATPAITLAQRLFLAADETVSGFADLDHGIALGDSLIQLPDLLEFTPANKTLPVLEAPPSNPSAWKISVNLSTGRFTGSFRLNDVIPAPTDTNPEATRPIRRNVAFQGILRQPPVGDPLVGAGYFLAPDLPNAFEPTTRSSAITLSAPSE